MAYVDQFKQYEQKLNELKEKCEQAEKEKITAEANIKIYTEQRDRLTKECETYAGVSIENIPKLLEQKTDELESIMNEIGTIDFNTRTVTEEDVKKVEEIIQKHGIMQKHGLETAEV